MHSGAEQRYVLEEVLGEDIGQLTHLLEALDAGAPPHAGIALGGSQTGLSLYCTVLYGMCECERVGGRIHSGAEQQYVLESVLGEESGQLTHLLEALDAGAPPHAGIALGTSARLC
jgi:aspartyl-tRNA synthetase